MFKWAWFPFKPWMEGLESNLKPKEQHDDMWIAPDAMSKYSTIWGFSTVLLAILTVVWITVWIKKWISNWLGNITESSLQKRVSQHTNDILCDTFVCPNDTIDYNKYPDLQEEREQQLPTK
jgi:hypothetical protein